MKIKIYKQVGKSDLHLDRLLDAKPPGWRKSKNGNWYFENRKNRSDGKGKKV